MFILQTAPVATAVSFVKTAVPATVTLAASSMYAAQALVSLTSLVLLNSNFLIITLDHMYGRCCASAFHCSGTRELVAERDPSAGRHGSRQPLASCGSLRFPRRSRLHCVGFKLNYKFGSCYWPSALRVVVFLQHFVINHPESCGPGVEQEAETTFATVTTSSTCLGNFAALSLHTARSTDHPFRERRQFSW